MSVAAPKIVWSHAARQAAFERWIAGIAPRHGLRIDSLAPASADASFRRYLRLDDFVKTLDHQKAGRCLGVAIAALYQLAVAIGLRLQ